jgi:DNA-binding response OmpR family regulator
MQKILVVDDDRSMLNLLRVRLSDTYQVIDTDDPEQVLGLAMQHKPAAILLDLMMPRYSGFELCQCLHSLSYTSRTPIFVITGESAERYKVHCQNLGAREFLEKPVDFPLLKTKLAAELQAERPERRAHVRIPLRVIVTLQGTDGDNQAFKEVTMTENVCAGGFLSTCPLSLSQDTFVTVFPGVGAGRYAGRARVVRRESPGTPWQKYGFQFLERTNEWVL